MSRFDLRWFRYAAMMLPLSPLRLCRLLLTPPLLPLMMLLPLRCRALMIYFDCFRRLAFTATRHFRFFAAMLQPPAPPTGDGLITPPLLRRPLLIILRRFSLFTIFCNVAFSFPPCCHSRSLLLLRYYFSPPLFSRFMPPRWLYFHRSLHDVA